MSMQIIMIIILKTKALLGGVVLQIRLFNVLLFSITLQSNMLVLTTSFHVLISVPLLITFNTSSFVGVFVAFYTCLRSIHAYTISYYMAFYFACSPHRFPFMHSFNFDARIRHGYDRNTGWIRKVHRFYK